MKRLERVVAACSDATASVSGWRSSIRPCGPRYFTSCRASVSSLRDSLAVLAGREIGRDDQVAREPGERQRLVGHVEFLAELLVGLVVPAARIRCRYSVTVCIRSAIGSPNAHVVLRSLCRRLPVERGDLLARQPDQRIAAAQRVVQEGEGVVLGQRGQPEASLARSTAIGFLSTPYRHRCATSRRACSTSSSSGGSFGTQL